MSMRSGRRREWSADCIGMILSGSHKVGLDMDGMLRCPVVPLSACFS